MILRRPPSWSEHADIRVFFHHNPRNPPIPIPTCLLKIVAAILAPSRRARNPTFMELWEYRVCNLQVIPYSS
jgi:hypothetical protein